MCLTCEEEGYCIEIWNVIVCSGDSFVAHGSNDESNIISCYLKGRTG